MVASLGVDGGPIDLAVHGGLAGAVEGLDDRGVSPGEFPNFAFHVPFRSSVVPPIDVVVTE